MSIKITRLIRALLSGHTKGHYGQYAEDALVRKHFNTKSENGECLDIGAYHPFRFNNTAFFWINGWKCINVDANPNSINLFKKLRPNDININAAIISQKKIDSGIRNIDLHIKKSDRNGIDPMGSLIKNSENHSSHKVRAASINQILNENCSSNLLYVNIDIEGLDKEVLFDFDFKKYRPRVFTIEEYAREINKIANGEIANFMRNNGYFFHSRADVTSIYVYSKHFDN